MHVECGGCYIRIALPEPLQDRFAVANALQPRIVLGEYVLKFPASAVKLQARGCSTVQRPLADWQKAAHIVGSWGASIARFP